jgi:hypothetical protein
MDELLERAYERGDHRTAVARARHLLAHATDPGDQERARNILAQTAPDPFLAYVGALGLGLTTWLVYNYVL